MCLIINVPRGKDFPRDALEAAYYTNSDGAGFMWVENDRVKTLKNPSADFEWIEQQFDRLQGEGRLFAVHLRFATHGKKDRENTHPFQILRKEADGRDLWMMHNGVLSDFPIFSKGRSDTWHFVENWLKPALKSNPKLIYRESFQKTMGKVIGVSSKLLFLDSGGQVVIINKEQGSNHTSGCWISNTYSINGAKLYRGKNVPARVKDQFTTTPSSSNNTGRTHSAYGTHGWRPGWEDDDDGYYSYEGYGAGNSNHRTQQEIDKEWNEAGYVKNANGVWVKSEPGVADYKPTVVEKGPLSNVVSGRIPPNADGEALPLTTPEYEFLQRMIDDSESSGALAVGRIVDAIGKGWDPAMFSQLFAQGLVRETDYLLRGVRRTVWSITARGMASLAKKRIAIAEAEFKDEAQRPGGNTEGAACAVGAQTKLPLLPAPSVHSKDDSRLQDIVGSAVKDMLKTSAQSCGFSVPEEEFEFQINDVLDMEDGELEQLLYTYPQAAIKFMREMASEVELVYGDEDDDDDESAWEDGDEDEDDGPRKVSQIR